MQNPDPVSGEVAGVDRQYPLNTIHIHRGDQPRVMDLAADNTVLDYQTFPFVVDGRGVGEQRQGPLDLYDLGQGQGRCESETVACDGSGNDIPELRDVLQCEVNRL